MNNAAAPGRQAGIVWLVAATCFLLLYFAWYPGVFTLDERDILDQALSGRRHDGHSPLLVELWRLAQPIKAGPAIPYLLGLGAAVALAAALLRRLLPSPFAAALGLCCLVLLPPVFVSLGQVTKDLFFVGAMLAVVLAALRYRAAPGPLRLAVVLATMQLAILIRIDAAFALFPIAAWLAWPALRRARAAPLAAALAGALAALLIVGLLLASKLASARLFKASAFHAEQVMMLFDLAAISIETDRMLLPPSRLGPAGFALPLLRARFNPASADALVWSRDRHHLVYAADADQGELHAAWGAAILAHPGEYARFRAEYAARFIGIRNNADSLRGQFFGDPSMLAEAGRGWRATGSPLQQLYYRLSNAPRLQWLYLPWFWLACASVPLALGGAGGGAAAAATPPREVAVLLVVSAVSYTASMALLSAAAIGRYHSWPRVAIGIALIVTLAGLAGAARRA